MKKTLLAAAAAVVLFGAPAFAMDKMAKPTMEATMMCRPAAAGEKPTAMMGSKGIVCKTMDKMDPKHMGPKTTGMTQAQADAAWRAWIEQMMLIQSAAAGGNG